MKDIKQLKTKLQELNESIELTENEINDSLKLLVNELYEMDFFDKFKLVEIDGGYTNNEVLQFKDCRFDDFGTKYNLERYKIISLKKIIDKKDYAHFHVDSESIYYGQEGYVISFVSKPNGIWLTLHSEFEHDGDIKMNVSEQEPKRPYEWRKMVSPIFDIPYEKTIDIKSFKDQITEILEQNKIDCTNFEANLKENIKRKAEKDKELEISKKIEQFNRLKKELEGGN